MKEPVRILSDLHLGHRGSRVRSAGQLAPLLEGVGTLVSNGDTWQELYEEYRDRGRRLFGEFQQLAAERQVGLVCLPGNHDPGCGASGYLDLAGGAVFVSHGDALYDEGSPWSRVLPRRRDRIAELFRQAGPRAGELDGRLRLAGEVARALVPPRIPGNRSLAACIWQAAVPPCRGVRMLAAWLGFPDRAARFLERFRPQARVFVCGHFHRAGCWRRRGRLIVNTGAFLPPAAAWMVDLAGGRLSVGRIERAGGVFRPGRRIASWRLDELPGAR